MEKMPGRVPRALPLVAFLLVSLPFPAHAQDNPAARAARAWRQGHERAILDEFIALLAIPNVSSDRENIGRNAKAIVAMMEKHGIAARQVSVAGGNPVVFGEIRTPGATRTIGFYAHYDGQPVDPKEWSSPPFEPALRDRRVDEGGRAQPLPLAGAPIDPEWRLYARGAADDKAPIVALMAALDGLRAAGIALKSHVKFMFDGEEETGSQHLEATLGANRSLFAADVWLMCDSPVYQTRQQSVVFGARGVTLVDITVYGPRTELHSGHYGNWAPNPALSLARLLASMKDESGRVVIDGFYDQVEPLGSLEKKSLSEAPAIDAALRQQFWLGANEDQGARTINELVTLPSLNVRGMAASHIGAQASNIIPATAEATLDVRMVKGMDPRRTAERITDHIRRQGYFVLDRDPTPDERRGHARVAKVVFPSLATGSRTPMDLPIAGEVVRTIESARGPVVRLPTMGGGLPLQEIERPLSTPTLVVPIANHDNNQHSSDENLRLQNLWDGIETLAALLAM